MDRSNDCDDNDERAMTETAPPVPIPDDKDWTWVLDRRCPECGFDTSNVQLDRVGELIRQNATAWHTVLARPDVGDRPVRDRWSPVEYACHVRDVFGVYLGRLDRMLTEDGPHYENWDQDATAGGGAVRPGIAGHGGC